MINKLISAAAHISAVTRSIDLYEAVTRLSPNQFQKITGHTKEDWVHFLENKDPVALRGFNRQFNSRRNFDNVAALRSISGHEDVEKYRARFVPKKDRLSMKNAT